MNSATVAKRGQAGWRVRLVWLMSAACLMAVPGVWPASPATAQTSQPGLVVNPSTVRSGEMVTIRPAVPCPPPAGAPQPTAQVGISGPLISDAISVRTQRVPVNPDGSWSATVQVTGTGHHFATASCTRDAEFSNTYLSYASADVTVPTTSVGYWVARSGALKADGFGDAIPFFGMFPSPVPVFPVVGVAGDASGLGYWTASSDGGIFTSGDAGFFGSAGRLRLAAPIRALAATRSGNGYWLAGADGGVFTFGDAYFAGSGAGSPNRSPVVGIARYGVHTGQSYLLARADGSVVEYGPRGQRQLNGPLALRAPVVGISATPSEAGYYLAAADGGVFTFADATFAGSLGGRTLAAPITGITARYDGGYWLVGADGGVFSFGGAPFAGSAVRTGQGRATAIAGTPDPLAPLARAAP